MNNSKLTSSAFILYLITLLVAVYIIVLYVVMDPTKYSFMEAKMNINQISFSLWKSIFYAHIIIGFASLALGTIQFTKDPQGSGNNHKIIGMIYTTSIFINALIVPYLAYYATGGLPSSIAFLTLDTLWLVTTWVGVWRMAQGKSHLHREWMQRSYALTLVFVTFRLLLSLLSLLMPENVELAYPISIVTAMVVNLIVVELYIHKNRKNSIAHPVLTA
jgi:uncharacterized membrane protein